MKWMLMWITIASNGQSMTSGSAAFESVEACYAAEKAYYGINLNLTMGKTIYTVSETVCVNMQSGEKMSSVKPPR